MIYVMADIHGHEGRFDSILQQIGLQPEDTLYVLGDVIDRNPAAGSFCGGSWSTSISGGSLSIMRV